MPQCCAFKCKNDGVHHFPNDKNSLQSWIEAVRRKNWKPTSASRLCREHFKPSDYYQESYYSGVKLERTRLKKGVVPSIFSYTESECQLHEPRRMKSEGIEKELLEISDSECRNIPDVAVNVEVKPEEMQIPKVVTSPKMSKSDADLEKYKRRLIKVVARMSNEGMTQDEVFKKLKEQNKTNHKALWCRMRNLVLKKLRLLFSFGDLCAKVPPMARMTFTDWLMFDLVLVDEAIDMISLAGPNQEEPDVSLQQPGHLWELFHLVKKHSVEQAKGQDFVKAWLNLTIQYNEPSSGRQCSPMLLQLRWYLLKEKTRNSFYKFWAYFNKQNKDELKKITPNSLYTAIAKAYPKVITEEFIPWKELVKKGGVVNPTQFQKKNKRGAATTSSKEVRTPTAKVTEETTTTDVVLIEPQIETITLDDDSDDQGDHAEFPAKSSSSQNKDIAPTSKAKEVVPSTSKHMDEDDDVEIITEIIPNRNSIPKDKNGVTTSSNDKCVLQSSSNNKESISISTSKDVIVISPITSRTIQPSTSKDSIPKVKEVEPSTSNQDIPPTNLENRPNVNLNNDFVITTDFDDDKDYNEYAKDLNDINDCIKADEESESAQEEENIRVDAETLQAFCGEQYIVNSFDDSDIDQELIDTKPVVVPEIDGLSSVKIVVTSHVQESSKTGSPIKNIESLSDQVSKSVDKTPEKDDKVSSLLEKDISPYSVVNSVIKIEEPDLREELKRQGKEDLLNIIPESSNDVVFDILDDGIELNDDGGRDKNGSDDTDDLSDSDETACKIDRKLLLYPFVYTVKLDEMNALRKQKNFALVKTKTLIENIFKESKVEIKTNVEESKEIETVKDSSNEEMLPEVKRILEEKLIELSTEKGSSSKNMVPEIKTETQEDIEEYDDPITVLPFQDAFFKTEDSNSEQSDTTEPPIKRVKISHHLFKKPYLRTYSPIQLCKNPDFNTRLKQISTGILVYQRNRHKLLECKPLTIDLDKGFERKLIDNTVYLNNDEKEAENTTAQKQSDAEDSLLKLILEKDASVYIRKPVFGEQELLAARKSKTINLPDIDQVRKLNQRLLTAEVTPISFGVKQNIASVTTEHPIETTLKESPPISPEEASIDERESPIAESEENLTFVELDKTPINVEPTEILNNSVKEEITQSIDVKENIVIEEKPIVTEIKQEKPEPEKVDKLKSVEDELAQIELATKYTLPDIEIIEPEKSAEKQVRSKYHPKPKPTKPTRRYRPAWSLPTRANEPKPGLVTNDTLLKMLKYLHGEEEDCVIVNQCQVIQDNETKIKKNKKKACKRLKRQAEKLGNTVTDPEAPLPGPSTKITKSKSTEQRRVYISNDPKPNFHPKLSSFCCWIKEIEYRINLPDFNLDCVPHPCLYFDAGICICCCREGAQKDLQETATQTEELQVVPPPALRITITSSNRNYPKTPARKWNESIGIQADMPPDTESQEETATVEKRQNMEQPTLLLDPANLGLDTSCNPEIIGILTADELAHLQKVRNDPPIKVTAGPVQKTVRVRKAKHKAPAPNSAKVQTIDENEYIVLSDDEDEGVKSGNQPHLVINPMQVPPLAPLTVTSGSSNRLIEKRKAEPNIPFKKIITHSKNQEIPLNLGQNKVLLTTVDVPANLNNVNINPAKKSDNNIQVQPLNSTVTAPLINLPKGVGIVLMPNNTLSVSVEPGTTISETELGHMPTLLALVQKQLGQHIGVAPTIVNTITTVNNEISLLSDDENDGDNTIETDNTTQEEYQSNDVDKSLEAAETNVSTDKDASVNQEATTINTDAIPNDSDDSTKSILIHCSEQLSEDDINETENSNTETTIEKENEPTSSELNTSQAVTDSNLQEKEIEETQTSENIQEDYIEETNKETTASPNEALNQKENSEMQEISPAKSFLKVKDFASVNSADVDASSESDPGQMKKTTLADLMEMSGISSEDAVPLMPETLENVVPFVSQTSENLLTSLMTSDAGNTVSTFMPTPGHIVPLVAPATPDVARLELNPVFTIKALKYAHKNNGKFYVLNLETGSIVPLKVSINRTKKVQLPKAKRKEMVDTRIDMVDSDVPMEEEHLVDSDDSSDTSTQTLPQLVTRPSHKLKVISGISKAQMQAINQQRSLLIKHNALRYDSKQAVKVTKAIPRIIRSGPLRRIKIRSKRGDDILIGKFCTMNQKDPNSLLKTATTELGESSSDLTKDTTDDVPDIINEVTLGEDQAEETQKDYSSSDDEPLSIMKNRKENTQRNYSRMKRPLEVEIEGGSNKRVRTNEEEANDGSIESSNTETSQTEKEASTEETQKKDEEISNESTTGLRTTEELETFDNSNDEEMQEIRIPSMERASEDDDEDFILGA